MKRPDPRHSTEAECLLKSKQEELESQEGKLFLKFAETHPQADLTLPVAEAIWSIFKIPEKERLSYHP